MISYELAKQLYGKGAPFKSDIPVTEANMKYIVFPTLSELIEACGDNILNLERNQSRPKLWRMRMYLKKGQAQNLRAQGAGDTPEEAVARLYIALNKK